MIKDLFNLIKKQNYDEIIKKINKSKNINFNFKFDNDSYFIEYVIESNNINFIKEILSKNISIDIIDSNGNTLLYNLIKFDNKNSLDIIKLLLNKNEKELTYGINIIDKQDINGRTCLFYCILFNNINALDLIIKQLNLLNNSNKKGLNKNELVDIEKIKDNNGDNILLYCFKTNRIKFISKILNIVKNIKSETNNNGENILHLSILTFSTDNIEFIIDIINKFGFFNHYNEKTFDEGLTPLQLLMTNINKFQKNNKLFDIIKSFSIHSNMFEQDNYANNILHTTIKEMNIEYLSYFISEIIKITLQKKINIDGSFFNFTNVFGYTPLHIFIETIKNENSNSESIKIITKILIQNTDLNIQNIYGDSIIHLLLKRNLFIQYSKFLENKEINIFIENKKKITPFELTKNYNSDDHSIIMNTIYKSYYNTLLSFGKNNVLAYSYKKLDSWEIKCSKNELNYDSCIKNIKEVIYSKKDKRSIPKERIINYDFDSGIAINNCFFTGYQIDTLFGLLLLKEKFNVKLLIGYPLTVNDNLEQLYSELGLDYTHEFNFNNIMIYWIYQHIVFPNVFDEKIKIYIKNKDIVIIPIGIELSNGAHTNILFCDFKNNIVERFEPNGNNPPVNFNYNPKLLDKILSQKFISFNSDIKYITPNDFLPNIGFSIIENIDSDCKNIGDPNGFCSVWCIWYCYQKLLNKDSDITNEMSNQSNSQQFVKYLIKILKLQSKNFKTVIRNFSKNISSLRDRFLHKYNMDINNWISYEYTEEKLINMEKDLIKNFLSYD